MLKKCERNCHKINKMYDYSVGQKVGYFFLFNRCGKCNLYLPKHIFKRCICCGQPLRYGKRSTNHKQKPNNYKHRFMTVEQKVKIVKDAQDKGWKLIKTKEMFVEFLHYMNIKRFELPEKLEADYDNINYEDWEGY